MPDELHWNTGIQSRNGLVELQSLNIPPLLGLGIMEICIISIPLWKIQTHLKKHEVTYPVGGWY